MNKMAYDTVFEALNDLATKGYTEDFTLLQEKNCLYCQGREHSLQADEFSIDEIHRFEGQTDPADEMIIYAISSQKHGIKGTLTNAFGVYADSKSSELIEKLKVKNNAQTKPLKRAKELIGLSREHHHGLLLCWKIKTGISKHIEPERMERYARWFYITHLLPHFEMEEKYIFTILDPNNEMVNKAIEQHRNLQILFNKGVYSNQILQEIQELLYAHIRFEERELFSILQLEGDLNKLQIPEEYAIMPLFIDNETDPFWV